MNSFNHYAYGAVGEWMYSVIGGIRPLAPGFKKILFAPEPGGGLTEAATSLQTTQGLASCRWRLHDRLFTVDLSVPDGVRATLKMPGGKSRTLNPGQNRQATRI